jgi:hypothetical protein
MRKVIAVLAALALTCCLESNPQPSPEKNEDPTNQNVGMDVVVFDTALPPQNDVAGGGGDHLMAEDAHTVGGDMTSDLMEDALLDMTELQVLPDVVETVHLDVPPELPDEVLDDDVAEEVELLEEEVAVPGHSSYMGGGTFFGECFGACKMDVMVDGDQVNFTARNWDGTVYVDNNATLTAKGVDMVEALALTLVDVELDETYGCPDCDDGGGAYVILRRNDEDSTHTYPFGAPPAELEACDAFTMLIRTAMAGCQSNDFVEISEDCTPLG